MESSQSLGISSDCRNYAIDNSLIWSPNNSNKIHGGNRKAEEFGYLLLDDSMSVLQMKELSQWKERDDSASLHALITQPVFSPEKPLEGRLAMIREDSDVAVDQTCRAVCIPLQDSEKRSSSSQLSRLWTRCLLLAPVCIVVASAHRG